MLFYKSEVHGEERIAEVEEWKSATHVLGLNRNVFSPSSFCCAAIGWSAARCERAGGNCHVLLLTQLLELREECTGHLFGRRRVAIESHPVIHQLFRQLLQERRWLA